MAQSTRQTFGVPSQGMLFESSDKVVQLLEARYTYEARLGELEQQFEVKAAKVREEYLAAVLEIHDSLEAKMSARARSGIGWVTHSGGCRHWRLFSSWRWPG